MKKQLFTLIALILLGGCSSGDNGRYQYIEYGVIDTRTGRLYYTDGGGKADTETLNEQYKKGYQDIVKNVENEQGN
jgi:hypothetical protein